jgi:hypothetical protein
MSVQEVGLRRGKVVKPRRHLISAGGQFSCLSYKSRTGPEPETLDEKM